MIVLPDVASLAVTGFHAHIYCVTIYIYIYIYVSVLIDNFKLSSVLSHV
jgi:hypothetical protein